MCHLLVNWIGDVLVDLLQLGLDLTGLCASIALLGLGVLLSFFVVPSPAPVWSCDLVF